MKTYTNNVMAPEHIDDAQSVVDIQVRKSELEQYRRMKQSRKDEVRRRRKHKDKRGHRGEQIR